jgi:uncharacterized protein
MELAALTFPELANARREVRSSLAKVSAHEDALAILGVGTSLAADVERNTRLEAEPAAPAHRIYSGVLYDALGYRTMTPAQRRKADEAVLVVSALWGAIGFSDRIPAYRLSMSVGLPGLGKLAGYWTKRCGSGPKANSLSTAVPAPMQPPGRLRPGRRWR